VTTEEDFQRRLDADPTDWPTRLVFADWLQERRDERAEGYRAAGGGCWCAPAHSASHDWWVYFAQEQAEPDSYYRPAAIPQDWFALAWDRARDRLPEWFGYPPLAPGTSRTSPRPAFALLPPERRPELLAGAGEGLKAGHIPRGHLDRHEPLVQGRTRRTRPASGTSPGTG